MHELALIPLLIVWLIEFCFKMKLLRLRLWKNLLNLFFLPSRHSLDLSPCALFLCRWFFLKNGLQEWLERCKKLLEYSRGYSDGLWWKFCDWKNEDFLAKFFSVTLVHTLYLQVWVTGFLIKLLCSSSFMVFLNFLVCDSWHFSNGFNVVLQSHVCNAQNSSPSRWHRPVHLTGSQCWPIYLLLQPRVGDWLIKPNDGRRPPSKQRIPLGL